MMSPVLVSSSRTVSSTSHVLTSCLHAEQCMRTQHGVDPKQLAAQLEGIRETQSPDASPSSSQQEFLTPSMSSQCSTPHSDPTSTSSDKQRRVPEKVCTSYTDFIRQGSGNTGMMI